MAILLAISGLLSSEVQVLVSQALRHLRAQCHLFNRVFPCSNLASTFRSPSVRGRYCTRIVLHYFHRLPLGASLPLCWVTTAPYDDMFACDWILATLALMMLAVTLVLYWKMPFTPPFMPQSEPPSKPPSMPPLTSLQGMPPELRNQVYELVAIDNISMRVISGKKLVASYQALNKERAIRLERTDLQWFVSDRPMASIKVPIIDVASILPSTTARHAVSNASRQLRAEFQAFEGQASAVNMSSSWTTLT
jgi:hypothetical protein